MAIGKNFEQLITKCEGQLCGDAALLRNSNDAAGEAITAAYLNLTFSTFAQRVELRSRVLQF